MDTMDKMTALLAMCGSVALLGGVVLGDIYAIMVGALVALGAVVLERGEK